MVYDLRVVAGKSSSNSNSKFFVKRVKPGETTESHEGETIKSNKKNCFFLISGSFAKYVSAKELLQNFRTLNAEEPDIKHIGDRLQELLPKTDQALAWYKIGHDRWNCLVTA